jgi:hypothetical protein
VDPKKYPITETRFSSFRLRNNLTCFTQTSRKDQKINLQLKWESGAAHKKQKQEDFIAGDRAQNEIRLIFQSYNFPSSAITQCKFQPF